jgi:predicted nucleic acid-binding protein
MWPIYPGWGRKGIRDIYGLQVIGTARIMVDAKHNGLLAEVAPCFEQLPQQGYWIHDSIIQAALKETREAD